MLIYALLVLVVSLAVLAKSSSVVVEKVVILSRFFGISQLAVGFLLIAVSTSIPELTVSVISSSQGEGAIAAGNVFGSNIANILLILGLGAFLYGFKVDKKALGGIGLVLLLTTAISAYIMFNGSLGNEVLGHADGLLLLALFVIYSMHVLRSSKTEDRDGGEPVRKRDALAAFLMFCGSLVAVLLSANFVVGSAVEISIELGVAESLIGATIIAIGTSLPELTIDLQAIRKKRYGLALGDAIGSNMSNLTLVLGSAALISPMTVTLPIFSIALLFAVVSNTLMFYLAAVDKKVGRRGGLLMLGMYAAYLLLMVWAQALA